MRKLAAAAYGSGEQRWRKPIAAVRVGRATAPVLPSWPPRCQSRTAGLLQSSPSATVPVPWSFEAAARDAKRAGDTVTSAAFEQSTEQCLEA